jgi:AMMECR1 domain-containing protein
MINENQLRGCIGTFTASPLEENLGKYAGISAFQDTRFSPISINELPNLYC